MQKDLDGKRLLRCALLPAMLALAALALVLLAEAVLIGRELLPLDAGRIYIIFGAVLAGAIGGGLSARLQPEKRMLGAMVCCGYLSAALIVLGLICGGGELEPSGLLYGLLSILAGGITGCVIATWKPRRRKRR